MANLLLSLSLILNIVALFCIVILYLRQNRLLEVENKQEKLLKEMEEVVSNYLIEMTDENEKFIDRVRGIISKSATTETESSPKAQHKTVKTIQVEEQEQIKTQNHPPLKKGTAFQAAQAYKNTVGLDKYVETIENEPLLPEIKESEEVEKKTNETTPKSETLFDKAQLLKKQGLSTEDIARRLNKGKTEIELLLKLRQNEKE